MDAVEEKAIVAILPKPAFRPLIEIATTGAGSDVTLINEPPLANNELEAAESCYWGDGAESNHQATNSPGIQVDSNRFDCLDEKVGLGVEP